MTARTPSDNQALKKALFKSTSSTPDESQGMDGLTLYLQVEQTTEACLKNEQKELHEERLRQVKEDCLKHIMDTSWKYKPLDKILGLD